MRAVNYWQRFRPKQVWRSCLCSIWSRTTTVTWLRSWGDEAFLIVVNFGPRESEAYMEKLPRQLLPHARDFPDYRLEPAYADPDDACAGYMYFNGNGSWFVKRVKAHGFCALRIRSRQTPISH